MQNTVCIFSLKNGSVTVCTCTESQSCAGPGPQPGQRGRGPQPRARRTCGSQKLPPLRGYGWKCHCHPLGTHQPHHKPSLQELRLAPAKGAAVDKVPGGELFLWAAPGSPPPPFITAAKDEGENNSSAQHRWWEGS